jgi:hypothetical protein
MQQPEYPRQQVSAILSEALASSRTRRHPAMVTSDRLGEAVTQWGHQFTLDELDMVARIRQRLEEIAEAPRE